MKLLFGQNISPKIVRQVATNFPDSKQVRQVGLEDASYTLILDYAKKNSYAIVTFDLDFVDLNVSKANRTRYITYIDPAKSHLEIT